MLRANIELPISNVRYRFIDIKLTVNFTGQTIEKKRKRSEGISQTLLKADNTAAIMHKPPAISIMMPIVCASSGGPAINTAPS
jgi:hypothetical protein